jgi:hypothetical protein
MKMKLKPLALAWVCLALSISGALPTLRAAEATGHRFDPSWPRLPLPNHWTLGGITGLTVDSQGVIWVVHRPEDLDDTENFATKSPPVAECCVRAPAVIAFHQDGRVLNAWDTVDWQQNEGHLIMVDRQGMVWVGSDILRVYTRDGKLLRSFGKAGSADAGPSTTDLVDRIIGGTLDEERGEVYITDNGFGGRVLVYDLATGAFKRGWGAYGKPLAEIGQPAKTPSAGPADFRRHVTVALSADGFLYAADRGGKRVQVFTRQGQFVKEFPVAASTGGRGSAGGIVLSPLPDQSKLFVPDIMNNVVWVLNRQDGQLLGRVGFMGRNGGGFHWLHMAAIDAQGNLYTGEVDTGRRLQRFVMPK